MYLVGTNNTWTTEATTLENVRAQGFEVQPSRRVGDFQIFSNGIMCGWLFRDQTAQIDFLRSKKMI